MSGLLALFSSQIEYDAAFPDGDPEGLATGICGVGLVDAGIGAARLIDRVDPAIVIFAGTCGAHRESRLEIGSVVLVSDVSIGSGDVATGAMRIPTLLPSLIEIDPALNRELGLLAASENIPLQVRCSCTVGVTEDDELAARLHAYGGSDVENLELFAVLRAASPRPAVALLGVTNIVGRGGGLGWQTNFRGMMKQLGDALGRVARHGPDLLSPFPFPKGSL